MGWRRLYIQQFVDENDRYIARPHHDTAYELKKKKKKPGTGKKKA